MSTALATVVSITAARPPIVRHRGTRDHFTAEQLKKFMQAAKQYGPREHAAFLFAFAHGARVSEIANLRVSDLNFEQKTIHVARLKGSMQSTQTFLKLDNPLFDEEAAFRAWLGVRQPESLNDFVFNSRKAGQIHRATLFLLFKEICERAGIEDQRLWHPHSFKHTCAMLMFKQNANAIAIRQYLGHQSFQSTLKYTKPSDREASEIAATAFGGVL
jgi:integrase/recombinase XerD